MRRSGGFTLIEILISLALAGLVVSGALQAHVSFTSQTIRQDAVNEVQQSLRLSMQIIERAIRSAGEGMPGDKLVMNTCSTPVTYYGLQYRNSNTFPFPSSYDTTAGDSDTDPDQLRVITTALAGTNLVKADTANVSTVLGDMTSWSAHDLFLVANVPPATSCLREVTSISAGALGHAIAGTTYPCINISPDTCMTATTFPAPVRRFVKETVFRVFPAVGAEPPKLAARYGTIGDVSNATPWTLIAEGIEDLQVALVMQDGTVCNDRDDPALCDPSLARAVRVTLVGRTAATLQGAPQSQTGGYEDRAATAVTDGYLRRAMTSEVVLRN
jgi:prepilin-type N-terminal cleavage/methylation domain-containing protein